jgi:carbamoylphosphate synthase large subunit
MGLTGNDYEDSVIAINKFSARQVFEKHGIKSPRFAIAHENVDLTEFQYPLIIKPVNCYSAVGVIKVEKKGDLQKAIQWSQERSNRNETIIEEFIEGLEATVDSISWNGKHYPLVIKERENIEGEKYPFKIAGHLPFELPFEIQEKILAETHKALNSINFRYGASNTQFRINEVGEVFVIEINPRMAGDFSHILMKLHNGYDIVKGVIDVALGQFEEPAFTEKKYSGVYFCRENTENIKHVIENKENDSDIVRAVFFTEDKINIDRICYFIYQSEQKRRWKK